METSRPKKPLSLKQRKLTFKPTTTDTSCNTHIQAPPSTSRLVPNEIELPKDQPEGISRSETIQTSLPNGLLFSGLCNLGNTCYVNSVLQALRFCPGFGAGVTKMESAMQPIDEEDNVEAIDSLSTLLSKLWQRMSYKEKTISKPSNKVTYLSPTKPDGFMAKLRNENQLFDNKSQHDAQEMLRFLLTNLHETYASYNPPPTTTSVSPHNNNVTTPPPIIMPSKLQPLTNSGRKKKRKWSTLSSSVKYIKLNSGKGKHVRTLKSFFGPSRVSPPPPTVSNTKQPHNFISDTFQGSLAYETHCFECENTTRRSELFLDVSLPVSTLGFPGFPPASSPIKMASSFFGTSVVGPYSLSWCLSQFALKEKLRGDNKYRCDECGRFTEAERGLLFSELPLVMTIHLNRFTAAQTWGHSSSITVNKIGGNVAIPLALSFKPWTTEDCNGRENVYDLFAVVFHSGLSCTSGHYTVCVRMLECVKTTQEALDKDTEGCCNSWLYFDDENVELLTQNELSLLLSPLSDHSSTAYILFYACQ